MLTEDPFPDVDSYIASFPEPVQVRLREIRAIIRKAAPNTTECFSYGMPAYRQHAVVVYFAGGKNHIGFYPTAAGIEAFTTELGPYKWSKGTVQFPLDQPVPEDLVRRMTEFRLRDDEVRKTTIYGKKK
ncbi:MAG: DUF1801 domain-containing protein [Chthonomonadales bacterium]